MSARLVLSATRKQVVDAAVTLAVGDIDDAQAFEALVSVVKLYLDARREDASTPAPTVPFGPHRGQPLKVLPKSELLSLERYVSESLRDAAKRRFVSANLALRAAILAELHRR